MAIKVPIYDQAQVRPNDAPMPQLRMNAPNMGAAIGQGLQQAAGVVSQVQEKARLEADQQVVREKAYEFQKVVNRSLEAAQQVQGDDIRNFQKWGGREGQTFADRQEELLAQARAGLSEGLNPRQKQLFDQHAMPTLEATAHSIRGHEFDQIRKIKDATDERLVNELGDGMLGAVGQDGKLDEGVLNTSIGGAMDVLRGAHERNGVGPDDSAYMTKSAISTKLRGVVDKLLERGNSTGAQALLDSPTYGGLFTEKDRQTYLDKTREKRDSLIALDAVTTAFPQFVEDGQVKLGELEAHLEKTLRDNPDAMEKAKAQANHKAQVMSQDRKREDIGVMDKVEQAIAQGASPHTVESLIQSSGASGSAKLALKQTARQWFSYKPGGDGSEREEQVARYASLLLNPEQWVGKGVEDFTKLQKQVGPQLFMNLLQMKSQMERPGAVTVDADLLKALVEKHNWSDGKGGILKARKDDFIALRAAVEQDIQHAKTQGERVDRTEEAKIINRNMATLNVTRMNGFRGGAKEDARPAYKVPANERIFLTQNYLMQKYGSGLFTPARLTRMSAKEWDTFYKEMVDSRGR